jgi:transcriptional regulator with GAF, ATPase, and Fis domain
VSAGTAVDSLFESELFGHVRGALTGAAASN